ncbi:hypothetical protein G5V58_08455 [Nocardioides anomalus]|uniref:Aminoglycoside phosphotransferase n=1 Tax=Nocardioides anomalus TaxID=2712223 RepID=A0A6G6WCN3_9ACTN|nr:hypothetical protein [Nocardioides anomalus]QIG42800.1 hypothetical protein G5V58_08455 [Nocardioides anomalus]
MSPSERVLDLFAVPDAVIPLGDASVVAGDLVLAPGHDPAVQDWLNPLLARLAVAMDTRPRRRPQDLRLAVPVPARDGSWVVDGWSACRYEPGSTITRDLDVTLAVGRVLHAELASAVPPRPEGQLVHTQLFGNVLLDEVGAPVVVDVHPDWLPVEVAEALCVVDAGVDLPDRPGTTAAREYRSLNPR